MIWAKYGTYTVTATLAPPTSQDVQLYGYNATHGDISQFCGISPTVCPTITTATNSVDLFHATDLAPFIMANFNLTSTAGTPGYGVLKTNTNGYGDFHNVTFSGLIDAINGDNSGSHYVFSYLSVTEFSVVNSTSHGISNQGSLETYLADGLLANNAGEGVLIAGSSTQSLSMARMVFYKNAKGVQTNSFVTCDTCIFDQNTGDGLYTSSTGAQPGVQNSIVWGNGGIGVDYNGSLSSTLPPANLFASNNAFGANTGGDGSANWSYATGISTAGTVALGSTNPFNNDAAFDFSLTTAAKSLLAGTGFPGAGPFGTGHLYIGPLQPAAPAAAYSGASYVE